MCSSKREMFILAGRLSKKICFCGFLLYVFGSLSTDAFSDADISPAVKQYESVIDKLKHILKYYGESNHLKENVDNGAAQLFLSQDVSIDYKFLLHFLDFPFARNREEGHRMVSIINEHNTLYYIYYRKELYQFYSLLVTLMLFGVLGDSFVCFIFRRRRNNENE